MILSEQFRFYGFFNSDENNDETSPHFLKRLVEKVEKLSERVNIEGILIGEDNRARE